ncbi:MAG: Ig-like domain-containing protein [Spirochaetia bacterium]|nr:Ig-like domain-containing protein [Spirochaetia bacterium]
MSVRASIGILALSVVGNALSLGCDHAAQVPRILLDPGLGSVPHVTASYPSLGTLNIPQSSTVFVEFDKDMDTETTQNAFSLTGSAPASGRMQWTGLRHLDYKLDSDLMPGNTFLLRVASSAQSKDRFGLTTEYLVSFTVGTTSQSPQVTSTTPANSAQGIVTTAGITFVFSRAMDKAAVQSAFSLSPSSAGSFTWTPDDASFTYQPFSPLNVGTTYTASLSTGARDAGGISISSGYSATFQVGNDFTRPTVSSVQEAGNPTALANNQTGVYKDSTLTITFSEPMDQTARTAVTLTKLSDSSTVSAVTSWNATFTQLTFDPVDPLEPLSTYRLSITTSAKDLAGNALQSNYNLAFTVDNSAGALNSNYVTIVSGTKTLPLATQVLNVTNTGVTSSVTVTPGTTMQAEFLFSHSLDLASIPDNLVITKILGVCTPSSPVMTKIQVLDQAPLTKNLLHLEFGGMSTCEYELKFFGTRTGFKSAVNGAQSGTWMQQDYKVYLKGL